MLVGVLMAVAALFLLYVNLVILPGFASAMAGGHGVPELRLLGFDAEWFRGFTDAMDDGAAEAYRSIHRSTALIAPLGMTVGWAAFVLLQSRGAALFRWVGLGVVALFTIVYLLGSSVLDRAVADPQDETLVGMASLLMNLRGALLAHRDGAELVGPLRLPPARSRVGLRAKGAARPAVGRSGRRRARLGAGRGLSPAGRASRLGARTSTGGQ